MNYKGSIIQPDPLNPGENEETLIVLETNEFLGSLVFNALLDEWQFEDDVTILWETRDSLGFGWLSSVNPMTRKETFLYDLVPDGFKTDPLRGRGLEAK